MQEAVFFTVADLLNVEVDLLFDTASTYLEIEDADEFGRFGKWKDSRPDLPQIVIGLAVTREGSRFGVGCGPATPTTASCRR